MREQPACFFLLKRQPHALKRVEPP